MATTPDEDTGSARPSLVYAGLQEGAASVQMSGLVTNLVEDGGTCTFELRSGSTLVTRAQAGLADASSTSCGTVEVPVSELDRGSWEATLDYAGPGGSGTSGAVTVDIP